MPITANFEEGRVLRTEEIESLRGRQLMKVQVTFADPASRLPDDLRGVVAPERENGTLKFMFSGDVDSLVKALAQTQVKALHLEEPTLEEIFMHYYEKEGAR